MWQSGLGQSGPKVLATATPIIVSAAGAIATAAGAGAIAGPIGAGIGALVGVIAGLWLAHDARVKGATQENQVVGSALQVFDSGLKAIFAAANSSDPTQNITAQQAITQCQQLLAMFWQKCLPFTRAPGAHDASGGGVNCSGLQCNSNCTVTCCVGCADLGPSIANSIAVFQAGGGTAQILEVYPSKYGLSERAGYSLTYTPPTVSSEASSLLSDITGGASGGSSILPLLLLAGVAAAVFL